MTHRWCWDAQDARETHKVVWVEYMCLSEHVHILHAVHLWCVDGSKTAIFGTRWHPIRQLALDDAKMTLFGARTRPGDANRTHTSQRGCRWWRGGVDSRMLLDNMEWCGWHFGQAMWTWNASGGGEIYYLAQQWWLCLTMATRDAEGTVSTKG